MKNRFYVPQLGSSIELTGDEFHHAVRVARCSIGEEVECFDGRGRNVIARVASIEHDSARLEIAGEGPLRESPVRITLAMALIQPEKFELVLQKGCELGVGAFVPLLTARTEVRPERVAGKLERWRRILLEATKQCGRAVLPSIATPAEFEAALECGGRKIVLDLDEGVAASPGEEREVVLFVGPEGGFTPEELARASAAGAELRSLGPRRLRAETAAIAAVVAFGGELVRA
jgi:16S rRNA (uracil1498-N3)-methyltransferase